MVLVLEKSFVLYSAYFPFAYASHFLRTCSDSVLTLVKHYIVAVSDFLKASLVTLWRKAD